MTGRCGCGSDATTPGQTGSTPTNDAVTYTPPYSPTTIYTYYRSQSCTQGRRQVRKCGVDTHGEHAERRPITGLWGRAPSGVQGQSPWSEGQGAKPPEAENLLAFGAQRKQQICLNLRILQTTSGKSGVDMSTPVHPGATPLAGTVNMMSL